jgi:hypothetical protein
LFVCGCGWAPQPVCINNNGSAVFKHFDPFVQASVLQTVLSVLGSQLSIYFRSFHSFKSKEALYSMFFVIGGNLYQSKKGKSVPLMSCRRRGGEDEKLLPILILGTRCGRVVSFPPRPRFTPGTHWIGDWVCPRAGLDARAWRKILCPCRGSNLDRPIVQPVVRHYTACATAAHSSRVAIFFSVRINGLQLNHTRSMLPSDLSYSTRWPI